MIIGCCGFGSSGSSVVSDYLLEFGDLFSHMDKLEFTWVMNVDGLIDLEYHLFNPHCRALDSIYAIARYRQMALKEMRMYTKSGGINKKDYLECIDDFLDSLIQVKWKWEIIENSSLYSLYIKHFLFCKKIIPFFERKMKRRINSFPFKQVSLSICPDDFLNKAKNHVSRLLKLLGVDEEKNVVIDQPFPGNNPEACFRYFKNPVAIVVDRDPRDIYVFSKIKLIGKNHYIPSDNVNEFITYYKLIRKNNSLSSSRVLRINFEDLVYKYNETTLKIRDFLKIGANPNPKTIFDPSLSIANTQVFKRYTQFDEDIKKIEAELSDYLYDFSQYDEPGKDLQMFFGKSPLHK